MAPSSCSISTLSDSAKSHHAEPDQKETHSSVSSTPTTTLPQHIMIFGASIKIDQFKNADNRVGKEVNQVPWEEEGFDIVKTATSVILGDDGDRGGKRKTRQFIDFFASDETKADQEPAGPGIKKRKITAVRPRYAPPSTDLDLSIGRVDEDCWKIKKVLTRSDIDGSSRLLLGKLLVQEHILPHVVGNRPEGEGVEVNIRDVDTGTEHLLVLKLWRSNSFVFMKNWKSDFVKRRKLKAKDEIGLRWDEEHSRLEFTLLNGN
ncbi:B3 domain-containing protein [Sesamum alatum]|uniref:B3 domain-containing protein n=1 Tax=Sesamum alatum TaxID=300844 RepID=A0AAE1YXN2_9LAMI|nr:B3 domain-containing protein [Sesamum alatum]